MYSENKRGQKAVLWIVVVTVLISVLVIVVNNIVVGSDNIVQQVIRLTISIGLSYALYVGSNWARWAWIILYTLGGLIGLFGGFVMLISSPFLGILTIFMGIVYITASALLFTMPDVKEHFGQ
ncbi:MAG: hypothetical protein AB8G95_16260 [Anaerolineae bacterium]